MKEKPHFKDTLSRLETLIADFERNTSDLNLDRVTYEPGTVILDEGILNDRLHIILEGEVDMLVRTHPQATLALYDLLANSLANRYRNMVLLNIAVNHLTEQLDTDRTQLRETVQDLENTRTQLVHKERLAGIAHELNNPGTALKHSAENLIRNLPARFAPGGGIPQGLLASIFEPNVTTKSGGGDFGLGLGLAISREIVERYGGDIHAENTRGGGARFKIRIPESIQPD